MLFYTYVYFVNNIVNLLTNKNFKNFNLYTFFYKREELKL